MKLIVLYGPPAVGKYTVAKELEKITKLKLFHNHDVLDLVAQFFPWESPEFNDLITKFRLEIIGSAAKAKLPGLIWTFCYAHPDDNQYIKKLIQTVKKHDGKAEFVLLTCGTNELNKRVQDPSRKKFQKIKSPKKLKKLLQEFELSTPIPFVKSLQIDNSKLSAKKVAAKIKKELKLL